MSAEEVYEVWGKPHGKVALTNTLEWGTILGLLELKFKKKRRGKNKSEN